jgi:hypothetical protein
MKFIVIAEKGVTINGKLHKKGEEFTGERYNGQISTALHFKQIKPTTLDAGSEAADADAKAKEALEKEQAAAKAKEEADAKAKADADAKAKPSK